MTPGLPYTAQETDGGLPASSQMLPAQESLFHRHINARASWGSSGLHGSLSKTYAFVLQLVSVIHDTTLCNAAPPIAGEEVIFSPTREAGNDAFVVTCVHKAPTHHEHKYMYAPTHYASEAAEVGVDAVQTREAVWQGRDRAPHLPAGPFCPHKPFILSDRRFLSCASRINISQMR